VYQIPIDQLHFLDECHVVSRSLWKKKSISPKGEPIIIFEQDDISFSYSLSLMLSTNQSPVITVRNQSNNSWDFLSFFLYLIENKNLVNGDYLIVDGASVHGGLHTIGILEELSNASGTRLRFLPSYSPELNPCELAFNKIKYVIKSQRDTTLSVPFQIAAAVSTISRDDCLAFYRHCYKRKPLNPSSG
jgi:transposase